MKKCLCLLTMCGLFGWSAYAQDGPKADLFIGYSFLRYNSAQTIPAFTANGGIGTFAYNFTNHLGIEAELGGYHNGNVNNFQFDSTSFSYLFGPRISWGRSKRIDPYVHLLVGGQYGTTSISSKSILVINPPIVTGTTPPTRYSADQNTFAFAAGGGLDIRLSKMFSLRPIQLDYYLTNYTTPSVAAPLAGSTSRVQNDLRYAAGILFNFGGAQ
jgi:opacity protein-like surface antigen